MRHHTYEEIVKFTPAERRRFDAELARERSSGMSRPQTLEELADLTVKRAIGDIRRWAKEIEAREAQPTMTAEEIRGMSGVALEKILRVAKEASAPMDRPQTIRSKAMSVMKYLADREQERDPTLSKEAAFSKAAATPEGRKMQGAYTEALRRGEPEDMPVPVAKAMPSICCDAYEQIERLAASLVQKDGRLTRASAVVAVLEQRPDLYGAHVAAHRG